VTPASVAGSLAVVNAENLFGMTITQTASEGAPSIYSSFSGVMDLKSGVFLCGTPEGVLLDSAATQMDTTGPEIISILPTEDPTQTIVSFNKPLDPISAQTSSNFALNNGVMVLAVMLMPGGKSVGLLTTPLVEGTTYTLTVNNVKDLTAGNVVAPNTYRTFIYSQGLAMTNLQVVSNKPYDWEILQVDDSVYLDRPYTYKSIPQIYQGLPVLRTASDDKIYADNPFISFDVNQDVTLHKYVWELNRASVLWLPGGYVCM